MGAEWDKDIALMIIAGVGIVLAFAYHIVKMGLAHEEKRMALKNSGADAGEVARLEQILAVTQTEMANLRERVQVLEKLATDDDRRLAGEIDRLRTADVRG